MKRPIFLILIILFLACAPFPVQATAKNTHTITDGIGRQIALPERLDRIICSGPGALRLITYFGAQDRVVAVDDIETRKRVFDARPYALANPQFKKRPVFGGFRGQDDPEKILGLTEQPQVIFKTYHTMGYDPVELESKTGIPVVVLQYGDLARYRDDFFQSLRIIGEVLNMPDRANALIHFFKRHIEELNRRTENLTNRKSCFIGGIAFKGPHGYQSTEPTYPPFRFVHARNIAATPKETRQLAHSSFSREKLLEENPDILFLDLSTLQMGKDHGGLYELRNDPIYQALDAVKAGRVYGVLPYNWYTQNFGSILADAWYIGKILYPEQFKDVDPEKQADEIYQFLLSKKVYAEMNRLFSNMVFKPVSMTHR